MSKIVLALEAAGLATRRADPADGRAVVLSATPKGARLMERGRQRRVARLTAELATLPATEVTLLEQAAGILRRLEQTSG